MRVFESLVAIMFPPLIEKWVDRLFKEEQEGVGNGGLKNTPRYNCVLESTKKKRVVSIYLFHLSTK
jgi:hypothetical protein